MEKETKFCFNCGAEIDKMAEICPKCGVRVMEPENKVPNSQKSAGLAALLSFLIIGVGQMYNGQVGKGVLLLIGAIISGLLFSVIIGFFTWIIIWIYAIFDAYTTANKINIGEIIV